MFQMTSRIAVAVALLSPCTAAFAADEAPGKATKTAWEANLEHDDSATISTGVAKARDPLNSATSTSVFKEPEIRRFTPGNLPEVMRTIPGVRVEVDPNETTNNYSIRGLPMVGDGAKYIQLQEDGLPVLEFGDIASASVDTFIRNDLNLGSIETIRGGSASTFASDAPGGVINFLSKTGEVEGGSIMASTGLKYGTKRLDADYGGRLGQDWRFHIGGFYTVGEGPRKVGYDAYRGGQVKFNITRQFANGYIRLYAKYLDQKVAPPLGAVPLGVTGTNASPQYAEIPGIAAKDDSAYSPYVSQLQLYSPFGKVVTTDPREGMRVKSQAIGLEAQFDIGGWTVSDRFRFSHNSSHSQQLTPLVAMPAAFFLPVFGGGLTASGTYLTGPNAGQAVPGNAYLQLDANVDNDYHNLDLAVNDLRGSRGFQLGGGNLTLTGGLYVAHQRIAIDRPLAFIIQSVAGNAQSALVDISNSGFPITQGSTIAFGSLGGNHGSLATFDVGHTITAPYGSFNFQKGRFSIGGSMRYNIDSVNGTAKEDYPVDTKFIDIDGNGVPSSFAETDVTFTRQNQPDLVNYTVRRLSWSVGVNWHVLDDLSVFARYSQGARFGADRIVKNSAINKVTGALIDPTTGRDPVQQAEVGFKFRKPGLIFNVTGFFAKTAESNSQLVNVGNTTLYVLVQRGYRAYGAEVEANWRRGPFSINAGATLTHAEITAAPSEVGIVGNLARHQPTLIYQLTPAYDTKLFTIGASIVGTTGSYAQDINKLRLPGYATVALFARVRPVERLELGLNVSNLFDKLAIVSVLDGTVPQTGVTLANTLTGRRATASVRLFF